jgi:hypothetical protein
MKNILNTLLAILVIAFATGKAKAQALDMAIISPHIQPSPASYPGTATFGFSLIAELLDQPLSSDDMGISYARITLTMNNLQGSSSIIPTGAGADFFNWQYIAAFNTYIGTSKDMTLLADVIYPFTFTDVPIIAASNTQNTGFLVNLTPPGDLLSSESNDDAGSIFTSAPLPVTLVSFSAVKEGNQAQLAWSTTDETNSDRFEVERSTSGKDWQKVGVVKSTGESTVLRWYTFTDKTPLNGENLYRLKMVDLDETYAYSTMRSVQFKGIADSGDLVYVYPNPSTDKVFLKTTALASVNQVSMLDLNGRAVLTSTSVVNGIDVKHLAVGPYLLRISNTDGSSSIHKVLINR